jgi:hypothetical protein
MSGELDQVQTLLRNIAKNETSPDAIRIIETLTRAMEELRNELLFERLETPDPLPENEVTHFKDRVYNQLKTERATDLVIGYNREYLEGFKPVTRLSMVQALVAIANEQKVTVPTLWRTLLDSRGHL